jgi:ParB family chromosome partitioning protein
MSIKIVERKQVPITSLEVSKLNARRTLKEEGLHDLANSIREIGVQQPLVVRKLTEQKYEIIIGQRRYEASKIAGIQQVPVTVIEASDQECLVISFSENIHRTDLTYDDKTFAAQDLMTEFKDEDVVAEKLGISRQTLRNYLGWAIVPLQVKQMVQDKKLSRDSAIRISRVIDDSKKIIEIAKKIIETSKGELRREIVNATISSPSDSVEDIFRAARTASVQNLNIKIDSRLAELLEKAVKEFDQEKTAIIEEALTEWFKKRELLPT